MKAFYKPVSGMLAELGIQTTLAAAMVAVQAQPVPMDSRFASLRTGDSEAAVAHVMQSEPKEVHRSSVLGLEKSILVFETGRTRHQVTFVGGRLVAKSVQTKPSSWNPF
jgi:hypothetical protein